ncbi:MAG TPA: alanine racemase [Thermoflexales bacterium]|nr:alanine racemase [Thermoflexales bacterium]
MSDQIAERPHPGHGRATELRVDLGAITHNARRLAEIAGVPLMAVIKADAYGHGAEMVARAALDGGAAALGVATVGEALRLRDAAIDAPILALGYTDPDNAEAIALRAVTCSIFDAEVGAQLAEAARAMGREIVVHVKVDTGMGRLGAQPEDTLPLLRALAGMPGLTVEGLYTHFATADSADEAFTREQIDRFDALLAEVTAAGLRPPLVHAANSAATLRHPRARYDLVRCGIALYGLDPDPDTPKPADFKPALSLITRVAQIKDLPAGASVSYGRRWYAGRASRIATLPIGYADGVRRVPAWREALVGGQRVPIVGRICMDYCMLDITDIPGVARGDEVVMFGRQGDEQITVEEVAGWLGTIPYEVTCALSERVPITTL